MGHGVIATSPANIRRMTSTLHAIFRDQLEQPNGNMDKAMQFFMQATSTGAQEDYSWLGAIPAFEQWLDSRPMTKLRQFGYTIRNVEFANGIECFLNEIEDDKTGQIEMKVRSLADGYPQHVFDQFVSLLEGGVTADCYDGKKFFATDHVEGDSGAQINYGTSALADTSFEAAYAQMLELKNDKGKNMNIVPTHLWTTPSQMTTAKEIVTAEKLASGATNTNANMVGLIIIPGLAVSTNWGLVDLSKMQKPFIKQNRRGVNFTAMDGQTEAQMFYNRKVAYGADCREGYGYGFWQCMHFDVGA